MNTQRKTLIIIVITFVLILVGLFFVYQSFIKESKVNESFDITENGSGKNSLFPKSGLSNKEIGNGITKNDVIPTLRQISSMPTSGGIVFNTEEGIKIRYIERATGHIFEATDSSLEQNRISNTTIPRVQESVWSPNGDMVILRYLDENEILKSFYGKISDGVSGIEGWFLSNNITDIDVHKDGSIFYIQKVGTGSNGIVSNFDGTNGKKTFSSTIHDWYPQWIGDSITITTKPSINVTGFMYLLKSGNYEKILSFSGLITHINPSGSKTLFSTSNVNETNLFVYNNDNEGITKIPFRTLAEKCVWANDVVFFCASPYDLSAGVVPDDWYKGSLSFYDDIFPYNTETNVAQIVFDAEENNVEFDAINLTVDQEGKMLLFTDKNNLSLWALSL